MRRTERSARLRRVESEISLPSLRFLFLPTLVECLGRLRPPPRIRDLLQNRIEHDTRANSSPSPLLQCPKIGALLKDFKER